MRYPLSKLDKFVYNAAIVISAVFCFGSILIFLLVSRNIAFADSSVIAVITETHNIKNADKLIFSIGISNSKAGTSYYLRCEFVFGDNECIFEHTSFNNMETEEILEYMLELKADFAKNMWLKMPTL